MSDKHAPGPMPAYTYSQDNLPEFTVMEITSNCTAAYIAPKGIIDEDSQG